MTQHHIVPHSNTLIIDVGTDTTKVGYARDFSPIKVVPTAHYGQGIVVGSLIANPKAYVEIVRQNVAEQPVSSVILIVHTSESDATLNLIRDAIIQRRFINAFYFMRSAVCEAFGAGKTVASVVSLSHGASTVSIVAKGLVAEYYKEGPLWSEDGRRNEDQERVLDAEAGRRLRGIIDRVMEMRNKNGMKKNSSYGTMVFTGGFFGNKEVASECQNYLKEKYGATMAELVVTDRPLECTFTGASVFGSNEESRRLFMSGM